MTVTKCPNCGAHVSAGLLSCPDCGFVFDQETEASSIIRNSVMELRDALLNAKTDVHKIIVIETFSMPSTQQSLIELMGFAYSNFSTSNGHSSEELSKAWLNKARLSYDKLSRSTSRNAELTQALEQYAFLREGSKDSRIKVIASEQKRRHRKLVIIGSAILSLIILLFMFLVIVSKIEEEPLPSLDDRIKEFVDSGEFDSARKVASEAEFPWEERNYMDQILESEIKWLVSNEQVEEAYGKVGEFNDEDKNNDWTQKLDALSTEN